MNKTGIEWATRTWNPVTGCTKVSPGCANCYAEVMAKRLQAMGTPGYENGFNTVVCHENRLIQPAKVKKPQIVFCCSMGDLFHEDVPIDFIDDVLFMMRRAPQHEFIVLTKRPERIPSVMEKWLAPVKGFSYRNPPSNLRIGVSVESEAMGRRIELLMKAASKYRFKTLVSFEPLLSKIYTFAVYVGSKTWLPNNCGIVRPDWVVAGCESGAGKRATNPEWFRRLRDQCAEEKTPLFIKQMEVDGKVVSMPELDGRVWDQMPPELAAIRKLNGGEE